MRAEGERRQVEIEQKRRAMLSVNSDKPKRQYSCKKCGYAIATNDVFCGTCGKSTRDAVCNTGDIYDPKVRGVEMAVSVSRKDAAS